MGIFLIYQIIVFSLSYGCIKNEGIFYKSQATHFHERKIEWHQIERAIFF